jgi:hypothetical protein
MPANASPDSVLLHMVSYYDHATGMVPRPTIVMDKKTHDAHDNPVMSIDRQGYIWIFSTSHGTSRPSYIHRSLKPYDINGFELVQPTMEAGDSMAPLTNFSYWQVWPRAAGGFEAYFTRYNNPVARTLFYAASDDGVRWTNHRRIAAFGVGHYQISAIGAGKTGSAFNYHPYSRTEGVHGLDLRTNLYYAETKDRGILWTNAAGEHLELPLDDIDNAALVKEYESDSLLVYLKDIAYDADDNPVILYITSRGYASGPENGPRRWNVARWTGEQWVFSVITASDNNYDMGSLYLSEDIWRMIGPTETCPQPFNPGGEVAMWESVDKGMTWKKIVQLTHNSPRNHTYVRSPVHAHPGFVAFWADGHGRQPSESRLYFANDRGEVFLLPPEMQEGEARPVQQ